MEGDGEEPDFKPGEIVESRTGFFPGLGEVIRNLETRHGWFVVVAPISATVASAWARSRAPAIRGT